MKSKMVGLFAVVMVALMAAGFAYSTFTDALSINATVSTGNVVVIWYPTPAYHLFLRPDYCTITFNGWGTDTLTVYAGNFYPGAKAIVGVVMKNVGSLPIKVKSLRLDVTSDPDGLKYVIYFGIPGMLNAAGNPVGQNEYAYSWDGKVYFKNTLAGWNGWTLDYASWGVPQPIIHPGSWYCVYGYFEMDPNAGDGYQGKTIEFTLKLVVEQAVP
ncbi:hypothetical protein KEJ32_05395 [Candidatus Bathyarchaeota archaeon]|nr:hypothetical protein [Candidatus Bathyarchaeota archaeon]